MTSVESQSEVQSELAPPFACVVCGTVLPKGGHQRRDVCCPGCGFPYEIADDYIRYDPDPLLKERFEKDWVLWKVLSNNGYISYVHLKEGSVSLPEREDVNRFRAFLERNLRRGFLLDVGCGPLEIPGYLMLDDPAGIQAIGLDPMDDIEFRGAKVIGCAEFLPWPDQAIDTIVFATSLDHVCSLDTTIQECHRVLNPGGRVIVWMSDRERKKNIFRRLRRSIVNLIRHLVKGYPVHKYTIYSNGVVLYTPHGAVDPYHAFAESPGVLTGIMKKHGFRLVDQEYRSVDEVNLCFEKV